MDHHIINKRRLLLGYYDSIIKYLILIIKNTITVYYALKLMKERKSLIAIKLVYERIN